MNNRYAILGSSRGLGHALYKTLFQQEDNAEFFLAARKIKEASRARIYPTDFSITPIPEPFLNELSNFNPTHVIYTAGGGPYGSFEKKKWEDHLWAINVNFLFPAQLLHVAANATDRFPLLSNVTFVGSQIAESSPDKMASSYAAAKHALKGLVTTIQAEESLKFDLKLFSPGYMLTDMLPINSAPRKENKAIPVEEAAEQLAQFIASS